VNDIAADIVHIQNLIIQGAGQKKILMVIFFLYMREKQPNGKNRSVHSSHTLRLTAEIAISQKKTLPN
jgi:hypothetical protein